MVSDSIQLLRNENLNGFSMNGYRVKVLIFYFYSITKKKILTLSNPIKKKKISNHSFEKKRINISDVL